jgi:hypothetical protein
VYVDIAEYFGVTLDYLLLGKGENHEELRKDIRTMIRMLKFMEKQL